MNFNLYYKSRQGELINLLKRLVNLESPTGDKKAVDACSAAAVQEFKKAGVKITVLSQKDIGNLQIIEYAPGVLKKEKDNILVLTHIDTVWPVGKIERMPFYISGPKLFGPGVLDMKAGLVMVISALNTINKLNIKPQKKITVFINSAEETGHEASHEVIRKLAGKSSAVLCLEPALPGGGLKLERKGRIVIRLDVKGRAAHAGTPEKGINAVEELMIQLGRLKKLKIRETTVNIGLVGGGEKPNIVAENAWAVLDIRFWTGRDKDRIIRTFKDLTPSLRGAHLKFSVQSLTPPMEKTKASGDLFRRAKEIAATLGADLTGGKTGGGSDASIASGMGIPTLDGLGPDGDGIHAEHEHLLLPSLVDRTALLTELLAKL